MTMTPRPSPQSQHRRLVAAAFASGILGATACGPSAAHLAAARHEIANFHDGCDDHQIVFVESMGDDINSTLVSRGCGAQSERFHCMQSPFGRAGPVRCERMQRRGGDWVVDINPVPQSMPAPPGWIRREEERSPPPTVPRPRR